MQNSFSTNVFINCPLDEKYKPLLRALLFTIHSCGYNPRIATERSDSGESRLEKIKELILDSQYSIHDLSRIKCQERNEYYRLNMSFEIGLDFGCRFFHCEDKKALILEEEKYSIQKGLSDLVGGDPKCHYGMPKKLVIEVRSWFIEIGVEGIDGGSKIWDDFNVFYADLYNKKLSEGFKKKEFENLPIPEFNRHIKEWIESVD